MAQLAARFAASLFARHVRFRVVEAARFLSRDFLSHADRERRKLESEAASTERRISELTANLEKEVRQLQELRLALRDLEEVLGVAPQLQMRTGTEPLGGRELREAAVTLLIQLDPPEPIHYRDWFRLLTEAGYDVAGQNPEATFLAQVSQDKRVRRIGRKSGLYELA